MIAILGLALIPIVLSVGVGRVVALRLPPARTAMLLSAFALTVSLSTGMLLCLTTYVGTVAVLPQVHPDDWSVAVLLNELPIPGGVAVAAGLLAVTLLARAGVHLVRVVVSVRASAAAASHLPGDGSLAVIEDEGVIA